ncbi:MAG: hypothetical protein FJ123_03390 [Deltaproteobacteria bacterium]|nr:hypothetical protein [Deltaproteobacteria bacterium]
MDHSVDIVKRAFGHRSLDRLPRGELWLGTDLFHKVNLEDNLKGHLTLINRLDQNILCLPISNNLPINKNLGYRYFNLQELEDVSMVRDLFLMVLIDGPFQRLVEKKGLTKILTEWKRGKDKIAKEYEKEHVEVDILIKQCLEMSVDAVVIADDLAGEGSSFIDPNEIEAFFSHFYTQAVSEIHRRNSYALFHSCGNIIRLIPKLVSFGFDGLAAVQHRVNNLISLKEKYGSTLTLMAGIEPEMLEIGKISSSSLKEYERLIQYFLLRGGLILSSCSGLYSGEFLERIQKLYRIADELSKE